MALFLIATWYPLFHLWDMSMNLFFSGLGHFCCECISFLCHVSFSHATQSKQPMLFWEEQQKNYRGKIITPPSYCLMTATHQAGSAFIIIIFFLTNFLVETRFDIHTHKHPRNYIASMYFVKQEGDYDTWTQKSLTIWPQTRYIIPYCRWKWTSLILEEMCNWRQSNAERMR